MRTVQIPVAFLDELEAYLYEIPYKYAKKPVEAIERLKAEERGPDAN